MIASDMTRRQFVTGAGLAGTAFLAGCSAKTGDADSTEGERVSGSTSGEKDEAGETDTGATSEAADDLARPSTCGALSVSGAHMVGKSGSAVQLKGFSTHGIAWFGQYVNAECFAELSGWGANVARLVMYTHENGGYCTDGDKSALRELLVNGVAYAAAADMYCIVDWHVLRDLDPNVYLEQAKEFWVWASAEFADADNVIFEICNEPNGSTTWADVKSYAQVILPIIRQNAPTKPVLVGTPNWCRQPDLAAADPLDDANVMYTLHFYAASHKDDLRGVLRSVVEGGTPVFVSEYGICKDSGTGGLDLDSAAAWMALMDELSVSSCCWSLSNKAESASYIVSSCEKTSGFEDDDLTACGKWVKSMLGGEIATQIEGASGDGAGTGASGSAGSLTLESTSTSGVEMTASLRQSWETNGEPYLLYDIMLDDAGWCELSFSADVELSDSWNCTATTSGNTVHVATDAARSDIGIIVYPK